MYWKEPLWKLKTLIDATKIWWEGEAKEHLCLRQRGIPNHVHMAYEISNSLDKVEQRSANNRSTKFPADIIESKNICDYCQLQGTGECDDLPCYMDAPQFIGRKLRAVR